MSESLQKIMAALATRRFPLEDEKRTQAAIAEALGSAEIDHRREQPIAGGVIDFVALGDVGIEVKIKGQPASIRRQLEAYAAEPTLAGLLLVTSKAVALPAEMKGKPVAQLHLGRAWL